MLNRDLWQSPGEDSGLFHWLIKWLSLRPAKRPPNAVIYRSNGALMIAPIIRSRAGIGLEVEPRMLLQPIDLGLLADQISDALARSNRVASNSGKSGESFQPFLKLAKVRSYRAFMRDARRISILKTADEFLVLEDENRGAKGFGLGRGSQPAAVLGSAFDVAQMVQTILEGDPPKAP